MINVVFDTNIYISGIFFSGKSREALELARKKKYKLFLSKKIIKELQDVLSTKFEISNRDITKIIQNIKSYTHIITAPSKVKMIRDPKDDMILDCAVAAMARYLVTGDKDLLVVQKYKQIEILTVNDFIERKPWI